MTVGIYIRVSTQEQVSEGHSIDSQKEKLSSYCNIQGWKDYRFYIEEGVSGKSTDRPKLQLLMDHIEKGQIKILLVYRLDRLTRSVIDLHKMLNFLQNHECAFKSATETYDTTTANGRMSMGIVSLLAQWESENMSERIRLNLEHKVLVEGERVGAVPYGFDLSDEEKLIKNEKSTILLDMIEKIENGWSANRISNYLNLTNDDRNWTANAVFRLLRNPAIYGATRWNDKIAEDTHEGIIEKNRFERLQQILLDRSIHHRRDVKSTYIFQGVLRCPTCDHTLSVNRFNRRRKDGSEYHGVIYRCQPCAKQNKKNFTIGEARFSKALIEYMAKVEFQPEEEEFSSTKSERDIYQNQLQQIERKREKYQKAWASDLISDTEFEKLMNETRYAYDECKKKLSECAEPLKQDIERLKEIVFVFNETFNDLTQDEKKKFISRFMRNIRYVTQEQQPIRTDQSKSGKGKPKVIITEVEFY
ncbi:recombinase family protein [Bacillus thuringiensis]|uniref:recombinase family protein n=1 Tax=Bacillus thuringiensis TaxID=1428 RepID=UPI0026E46D04|nr:recombinase family protein [Bacillus thuringiensis]MDO6633211.1 recombinase family protein [Bacillus thuringiensis]MDO6662529.1 recombinase family protein [Bacillus thuringiensis]MDO6703384.1 recombinase family protein [Bacillus thuringiensis]